MQAMSDARKRTGMTQKDLAAGMGMTLKLEFVPQTN